MQLRVNRGVSAILPDPSDGERSVMAAQYRATAAILDSDGLTADSVKRLGTNCAAFTNGVLAKERQAVPRACNAGCSWCCVLEISAWPTEVLHLTGLIENKVSPDEQRTLLRKLRETLQLRDESWARGEVPRVYCPLLSPDGKCSVYEVRPSSCSAAENDLEEPCRAYAEGWSGDDEGEMRTILPLLLPAEVVAHAIQEQKGPLVTASGGRIDFHEGLLTALELGADNAAATWLKGQDVFRGPRDRFRRRNEDPTAIASATD